MRKGAHKFIAIVIVVCCFCANSVAIAAESHVFPSSDKVQTVSLAASRASRSFTININPNAYARGDSDFPLEAGETVRIYATFSPESADVDFGLIDPDNVFHYVSAESGSVDATFEIPKSGNYRLGIRNNSDQAIKVSGFVRY